MIAVAIALNFTIVSKVKSVKRTFVGTCVISTWLVHLLSFASLFSGYS